jgi:predicted flap endonuclease-1-like 5' DNA nuclease/cell division protein FtsB
MEIAIPELTIEHIGLLALALVVGIVLGWFFRADRAGKEKIAVNAGWQDQLESQQAEQDRLAEQNKSLMEQISQYQNSHQDSVNRAKELSETLRESLKAREEMQKQLVEFRTKLEATAEQRNKLQAAIEKHELESKNSTTGLKEKDDKIFHLSRELTSWQSRVPPLVEKFQERDKQAKELEEELAEATARIEAFEAMTRANETRIEPVDAGTLPDGLDASNEPHSDTSAHAVSKLQDQIDNADDNGAATEEEPETFDEIAAAESDLIAADVFIAAEDESADEPDADSQKSEDELLGAAQRILDEDSESADDKDDLKQIKGVGPAIEKTLNELGIYSFNQIAEISEYEIDRVAQRLKGFRSQIYRQDWIGQARDLHYQKNNSPS